MFGLSHSPFVLSSKNQLGSSSELLLRSIFFACGVCGRACIILVRHQVLLVVHMNCICIVCRCDIIDTRRGVWSVPVPLRSVVRVSGPRACASIYCISAYILNLLHASRVAPVHATGSWKFQKKKMPFLRGLIYFVIFCGFVPWLVFFRSRCPFERFFSRRIW